MSSKSTWSDLYRKIDIQKGLVSEAVAAQASAETEQIRLSFDLEICKGKHRLRFYEERLSLKFAKLKRQIANIPIDDTGSSSSTARTE